MALEPHAGCGANFGEKNATIIDPRLLRLFTTVNRWNFTKPCAREGTISQRAPGGLATIRSSLPHLYFSILHAQASDGWERAAHSKIL